MPYAPTADLIVSRDTSAAGQAAQPQLMGWNEIIFGGLIVIGLGAFFSSDVFVPARHNAIVQTKSAGANPSHTRMTIPTDALAGEVFLYGFRDD